MSLRAVSDCLGKQLCVWRLFLSWLLALCTFGGQPVDVLVLHTTDIHGHIESGFGESECGGWLKLASLIRAQRMAAGSDRVVLIDCGDTTQGTLLASRTRGQVAIEMLDAVDYDVWVPGNHEFDYGVKRFEALLQAAGSRVLCGNVRIRQRGGSSEAGECITYPAWRLIERGGCRLAVIGATASYLGHWFEGEGYDGLETESAMAMLERIIKEVHGAKPDAIILAAHQGWLFNDRRGVNEIQAIAERFPEIDLILGGHTHRDIAGMRIGSRTWYAQSASGAESLGIVTLTIDPESDTVLDVTSKLLRPDQKTAMDSEAMRRVAGDIDDADRFSVKNVGVLSRAVSAGGMPGQDCGTSELICQAIGTAVAADVVLHGRLSSSHLASGPVSEADLFSLVPYENRIGCAWLTPDEIVCVMAEQLQQQKSSAYCGIWGMRVKRGSDRQLTLLTATGSPLPSDQRLKVAFNSYTMAGGGGRFPELKRILSQPETKTIDTGIDTRDALREFLKNHSPFNLKTTCWID